MEVKKGQRIRIVNDGPYGASTKILDEDGRDLMQAGLRVGSIDIHIGREVGISLTLTRAGIEVIGKIVGLDMNDGRYAIEVPATHAVQIVAGEDGKQVVYFERVS